MEKGMDLLESINSFNEKIISDHVKMNSVVDDNVDMEVLKEVRQMRHKVDTISLRVTITMYLLILWTAIGGVYGLYQLVELLSKTVK